MKINNSLIVVLLLAVAGNMYGMDTKPFPFTDLPKDMQQEITVIFLNNEINSLPAELKSLEIAADKIRAFASVNKAFNDAINNPQFCLKLIKQLAKRFVFNDDKRAAKALDTKCAQERLKLQKEFADFITKQKFSMNTFESFYKRGVDLEWEFFGNTPLSLAINAYNLDAINALIKQGADVNRPYTEHTKPTLLDKVISNGEGNEYFPATPEEKKQAIEVIKILLAAGADVNKVTQIHRESDTFKTAQAQMSGK